MVYIEYTSLLGEKKHIPVSRVGGVELMHDINQIPGNDGVGILKLGEDGRPEKNEDGTLHRIIIYSGALYGDLPKRLFAGLEAYLDDYLFGSRTLPAESYVVSDMYPDMNDDEYSFVRFTNESRLILRDNVGGVIGVLPLDFINYTTLIDGERVCIYYTDKHKMRPQRTIYLCPLSNIKQVEIPIGEAFRIFQEINALYDAYDLVRSHYYDDDYDACTPVIIDLGKYSDTHYVGDIS